jgi:hypothetical protein
MAESVPQTQTLKVSVSPKGKLCSFCKKLSEDPERIIALSKEIREKFLANEHFERYEGCTCQNPIPFAVPILRVEEPLTYNQCGCVSLPFTMCFPIYTHESPLGCCKKCPEAIKNQQIIEDHKKEGKLVAVGCKCLCHLPQICQSV